jgi:3-oxoacyl-[acyl-carrier-protein] synthase-3
LINFAAFSRKANRLTKKRIMSKITAAITGVAGYVPEYVVTNAELEKLVNTSDEWIMSRTGIKERRRIQKGWAASDMAAAAVRDLLCATVTGDMKFPDTATLTCHKIGANNAFGYDLAAACSGFLFALQTGSQFIESGRYKKVVVVGVDVMSTITDYTDRTTCILFGDGCGAILLEPNTDGFGVQDSILRSDGSGSDWLHMKGGGSLHPPSYETIDKKMHFLYQEGRPVFKAAVNGMSSTMKALMERNQLTINDINWIVPHQANKRIISAVADFSGAPMEKIMVNIHKYGNTTAATLPLCLWDYESKLKKGDNLILTAFGGGFTWGSIFVKWAY